MFVIDVEASGLFEGSYPIEIAFVSINEESENSFLIMPADDWESWDLISEEVHGIARNSLYKKGISVFQAASKLNCALHNQIVVSDAIEWDAYWLKRLFDEAGVEQNFKIKSVTEFVAPEIFFTKSDQLLKKHRALDDAQQIASILRDLLN